MTEISTNHLPYISSRNNPLIKQIAKLKTHRYRSQLRQFIIEGLRELIRAKNNHVELDNLYICKEFLQNNNASQSFLSEWIHDHAPITLLSPGAFAKLSNRQTPDGFLATSKVDKASIENLNLPRNPLILVAEGIEKPGNLGALIRSTVAAGCHALLLTNPLVDLYHPNTIRNSQGLVFSLPCVTTTNDELIKFLKQNQIQTIATFPNAKKIYWNCDMIKPTAIFVGNEANGLSEFWRKQANEAVSIPVTPESESLNVATAATLCLFEAVKQRMR